MAAIICFVAPDSYPFNLSFHIPCDWRRIFENLKSVCLAELTVTVIVVGYLYDLFKDLFGDRTAPLALGALPVCIIPVGLRDLPPGGRFCALRMLEAQYRCYSVTVNLCRYHLL